MREIVIIITILLIVFSGDLLINRYLKSSSKNIIEDLKVLKKEISQEKIEIKKLKNNTEKIYKKWEKTGKAWAIIVLHSELDQIEISLIKMRANIDKNNLDIALEELETSIFLVNHISEKEKFCIKNVF